MYPCHVAIFPSVRRLTKDPPRWRGVKKLGLSHDEFPSEPTETALPCFELIEDGRLKISRAAQAHLTPSPCSAFFVLGGTKSTSPRARIAIIQCRTHNR